MKYVYMNSDGDLFLFSWGWDHRGYTCDNLFYWLSYNTIPLYDAVCLGPL